jgi:hypothetical protein
VKLVCQICRQSYIQKWVLTHTGIAPVHGLGRIELVLATGLYRQEVAELLGPNANIEASTKKLLLPSKEVRTSVSDSLRADGKATYENLLIRARIPQHPPREYQGSHEAAGR